MFRGYVQTHKYTVHVGLLLRTRLYHEWQVFSRCFCQIFCSKCCSTRIKLKYMDSKEARVCVSCLNTILRGKVLFSILYLFVCVSVCLCVYSTYDAVHASSWNTWTARRPVCVSAASIQYKEVRLYIQHFVFVCLCVCLSACVYYVLHNDAMHTSNWNTWTTKRPLICISCLTWIQQ